MDIFHHSLEFIMFHYTFVKDHDKTYMYFYIPSDNTAQ